jgi:hypothetical protein
LEGKCGIAGQVRVGPGMIRGFGGFVCIERMGCVLPVWVMKSSVYLTDSSGKGLMRFQFELNGSVLLFQTLSLHTYTHTYIHHTDHTLPLYLFHHHRTLTPLTHHGILPIVQRVRLPPAAATTRTSSSHLRHLEHITPRTHLVHSKYRRQGRPQMGEADHGTRQDCLSKVQR